MFLAGTTEEVAGVDAEEDQTVAEEVAEDSVDVDAAVNEEASDQDTKKNSVFSVDPFTAHLVLTAPDKNFKLLFEQRLHL